MEDFKADNNTFLNEAPPQAQEVKKQLDPDEVSAVFINQAHKQFRKLGYSIANRKKRAAIRVLEAVLFEPLEKVELSGKEEQQLFDLCTKIMYHKGVVMRYAFERMEKIKKGEEKHEQQEEMA